MSTYKPDHRGTGILANSREVGEAAMVAAEAGAAYIRGSVGSDVEQVIVEPQQVRAGRDNRPRPGAAVVIEPRHPGVYSRTNAALRNAIPVIERGGR